MIQAMMRKAVIAGAVAFLLATPAAAKALICSEKISSPWSKVVSPKGAKKRPVALTFPAARPWRRRSDGLPRTACYIYNYCQPEWPGRPAAEYDSLRKFPRSSFLHDREYRRNDIVYVDKQ